MSKLIQEIELECKADDIAAVLGRLEDLRSLPEGWDGYGADPIDPAILAGVERFLSELPSDFVPTRPQVVPMTRGRVQLEWHRGGRSLELEFESPESVHYLKCDPATGIEEEEILPMSEQGRILDLLRWFVAK